MTHRKTGITKTNVNWRDFNIPLPMVLIYWSQTKLNFAIFVKCQNCDNNGALLYYHGDHGYTIYTINH